MPFHYQILTRAKMSYIDKYFYTYRIRAISIMTSSVSKERIFDLCDVFTEIYNITKNKCNLEQFLNYFYSNLFSKLSNYQIKSVEVAKYIIDTIKQFDISNLFECKNRDAIFLIKAGLRMTLENYMEYLNKKNLKIKIKEIAKLKEIKKNRNDRIKKLNEQIKTKNEQLQQKNEQIKTKNEQLQQKNEAIAKRDDLIKEKNEQLQQKNEQLQQKNKQIKTRDSAINQKNSEIQNLHNQNNIQEQVIKRLENFWSYKIGRLFTYPLSIPLKFYKFIRDYNLIKKSNLFDSEYYLAQNEDVKKAKIDPIKHYLKFGWKEGRNPSAKFNGNEYLNKRPDVQVAGICPLVHYIKFGKNEEFSFLLEKLKKLESENKILQNKNKKFENDNKNLEKRLNEKSIECEQLNRKKIDIDIKLAESTKNFEKLNKKVIDLEKFKSDIQFVYNRGINKEKISYEIDKFFNSSESGITDEKRELELIVSLTSYPARIHEVYYTIFSIFTQTLKPNKIILFLGEDKFPNRDRDLPKNLLKFTKYGLEIRYTKDLKSHTKLIPALKEYPSSLIVTADDDIFYSNNWLEKLYNCWKNNKDCIICHRIAKAEMTKDKKFVPFNDWKQPKNLDNSSLSNCLLGVYGVLYPPNSLYKDVFDEELF